MESESLTIINRSDGVHVKLTQQFPSTSKKYFMLSHGKNQKWNHEKMTEKLKQYYPSQSIRTQQDYPVGYECWINHGDHEIHFELNKYDKTMGIMGEDRKKIQGYSKNGYILTLPDN